MITKKVYYNGFLYVCGFLLLWEWLHPMEKITNTVGIPYFIIFIAVSLLLNFLPINRWFSYFIKTGIILIFLYLIFPIANEGVVHWLGEVVQQLAVDFTSLFTGRMYELSDFFLTILFFSLLWIMTYLVHYWLAVSKSIFVFYFLTVIYVAVLDTFTIYNGEWAIVRIVGIGFIILGLLFFQKLLEYEHIGNRLRLIAKWAIPLGVLVTASMLIGYISPKAGPIWPDPVPFIQSSADNVMTRSNETSKVGYGSDDSQLGGPFIGDERVVFEAKTASRQYWRVETKDVYTGKGWTTFMRSEPQGEIQPGEAFMLDYASTTDEPMRDAFIDMKITYPHIVVPYGFNAVQGNEDGHFKFDRALNKIIAYNDQGDMTNLENYHLQYKRAAYSMSELKGTTHLPQDEQFESIMEQYTQLPESMPDRVKELAYELTSEHTNWFDKAKAIERYFQNGEFFYDQTNVAIPEGNQDYVDQFIFETQRGYCDNFSSSMVVLLRAVDIPARWAKGYASGEFTGVVEEGNRIFEVTNNDAHSWVEVYFPTQGWVPFEPTIGFSNLTSYIYDEQKEDDPSPINPTDNQVNQPIAPELDEQPLEEVNQEEENATTETTSDKFQTFVMEHYIKIIMIFLVIIVLMMLLYTNRSKWIPYLLLLKYERQKNAAAFVNAYRDLLKQLERFGVKRETGQTLREFAKYVDFHFNTEDMSVLTKEYERLIYSGDNEDFQDWEEERLLWKSLLKRTTS